MTATSPHKKKYSQKRTQDVLRIHNKYIRPDNLIDHLWNVVKTKGNNYNRLTEETGEHGFKLPAPNLELKTHILREKIQNPLRQVNAVSLRGCLVYFSRFFGMTDWSVK